MVRPLWFPILSLTILLMVPPVLVMDGASGLQIPAEATPDQMPTGPWDQSVWTRYRDLDDTVNELRVLSTNYPNICRLYNLSGMFPYPGGTPRYSIEGRTFWGLKISDDPDLNETDEPEVFYCAMTHAREWISNEVLMYFVNYLLRNYDQNSTISSMVNTTQLWFIPIVNPDGFQESIDQDDFNNSYGIYGWRKNVNETNGSPGFQNLGYAYGDGTDLNRNFGHKWGYPGSSPDPENPLYRGSTSFSEPETQIIRELFSTREFTMGLSLHSYGGLNLYPWGYTSVPPVDAPLLSRIAQGISDINGYTAQQGYSLYQTSGDFVDFAYGTYRIPAFTVEINHRNSRFIPELSKVPEDCHLNREVCMLMATLSHDPYSVFGSGINGTVKDALGRDVGPVTVNIRGMNRDINITTLPNGSFRVSLEAGSYEISIVKGVLNNHTRTNVQTDRFVNALYLMREQVPPEVSSINITVKGSPVGVVEWGEEVTITVGERYNETNLTGIVEVYDPGWTEPISILELSPQGKAYEVVWDTRLMEPQMKYALEAKLMDEYGNWDLDGSDPHALDRFIDVLDTTPPEVYAISLEGDRNDDGSFEKGEDIRIWVNITGGSDWEASAEVNASVMGPDGNVTSMDLVWQPVTDRFRGTIVTGDLKVGNHTLMVRASDRFGNGIEAPNVPFKLADTTGPEFILFIRNYQTGAYRSGTLMEMVIRPTVMEPGLVASIDLFGPDHEVELTEAVIDPDGTTFTLTWDSWNVPTGLYHAEGRLYDPFGNHLPDGAQPGHDLSFNMLDVDPPEVASMTVNGMNVTFQMTANSTENATLTVVPKEWEEGMICAVEWSMIGITTMGRTDLDPVQDRYTGVLEASSLGGYGQYYLEVVLTDRFGNADPDGLRPDNDLVLELRRSEPRFSEVRAFNQDHGEVWSEGVTEWVLEGELIELSCDILDMKEGDIIELHLNSQHREIEVIMDPANGTAEALFIWNTTGRTGRFNITWRVMTGLSSSVASPLFSAMVVPRTREHARDVEVKGNHPDGTGGLVVNVSWTAPWDAYGLKVISSKRSGMNWTVHKVFELDPWAANGSFPVPWEDMRFLVVVVHSLFPNGSDRTNETAEFALMVEGVSMVTFTAPDRPLPPVDEGPVPDDGDLLDEIIPAAVIAAFVLLAIMVLLLLVLGRRRRTLPPEVWEE